MNLSKPKTILFSYAKAIDAIIDFTLFQSFNNNHHPSFDHNS